MTDARLAKVGHRIAELRKEKGWRQHDLAEAVGLTRSSIANIEVGRQELSLTNLWAIVDALGSTVGEITATPAMPWLELARRTFASQRAYTELAEKSWQSYSVVDAVRLRGMADGIGIARDHHLDLTNGPVAEVPDAG